jgi:hypothetical protein
VANVVLQQGDLAILNSVRLAANVVTRLHLFQQPHTPAITDTDATYSAIEANFSGYSPQPLAQWNPAFLNSQGIGEIDANAVTFTQSGGPTNNTIYGAYVTDDSGHVCYAEQFSAPVLMNTGGATLTYTAKLTCQTA